MVGIGFEVIGINQLVDRGACLDIIIFPTVKLRVLYQSKFKEVLALADTLENFRVNASNLRNI